MKKSIGIFILFMFISVCLNAIEDKSVKSAVLVFSCENEAWDAADAWYDSTGDGFGAAEAYEAEYILCIARFKKGINGDK